MPLFRRNKPASPPPPQQPGTAQAPASSSEDCTAHSPCRELLAIPTAQRDSLLRLILGRTRDLGADAISVYLNDELSARLVVMGPGESGAVQRAYAVPGHLAERWGTTPPDLLRRALENMRGDDVEVAAHEQGETSPLYTVIDQGVSGAAHLVRLEQALGVDLPNGAIVGIPREHQLLAVPIRTARDISTIEAMLNLVRDVGARAQDRVSLDVFWLHKGRLHPFNAEVKDGRLERIFPPDEFRTLLDALPKA
ncbi:hypothetical protein BTM25_38090 [Actinomadura rubteroloni]|uniref:Uncharacterized protein n=1 Tax=Actinomadura rubteroloni TaxID=1926885 RepID=A0A2P4UJF6_9ACTN|nr:hypothetical protein [Actinomadura rubteroloni]POM25166.1 hypothetical protein BTM25_38090 [Actinomadura rubteroloni]